MDTQEFIQVVKRHPELWDRKYKLYYHKDSKAEAWQRVSKIMNVNENTVRGKWKNLRDTFRSEYYKILNKQSDDDAPISFDSSKWVWFEDMFFLEDVITTTKPRINNSRDQQYETEEVYLIGDASTVDYDLQQSPRTNSPTEFAPKRKKPEPAEFEFTKLKKRKMNTLENSNRSEKQDESFHFAMSLLPHLRELSPESRLSARIKIEKVLYNELYKEESQKPTMDVEISAANIKSEEYGGSTEELSLNERDI